MRSFLRGVATLVAGISASVAYAADLPTRKDLPSPAPYAVQAYNWSGVYLGLTAGYGWANAAQSYTISSATLAAAPPIIPVIDASGSHDLGLRGALLGAEAGYDWQGDDAFVYGVVADAQWSGLSGSQFNGGNVPNYPPGYPYSIAQKFQPDFESSLRFRVGVTPMDRLLLYATGGAAIAHFGYTSAYTDYWSENEGVSLNTYRPGWTVGLGVEYALTYNLSAKAEYRYSQYIAAKGEGSTTLTDGTTAYAAHSIGVMQENSVRLGLDYHFR